MVVSHHRFGLYFYVPCTKPYKLCTHARKSTMNDTKESMIIGINIHFLPLSRTVRSKTKAKITDFHISLQVLRFSLSVFCGTRNFCCTHLWGECVGNWKTRPIEHEFQWRGMPRSLPLPLPICRFVCSPIIIVIIIVFVCFFSPKFGTIIISINYDFICTFPR